MTKTSTQNGKKDLLFDKEKTMKSYLINLRKIGPGLLHLVQGINTLIENLDVNGFIVRCQNLTDEMTNPRILSTFWQPKH